MGSAGADDPWKQAHDAAASAGVSLRPLTTLDEADRVIGVMVATWGSEEQLSRDFVRALQGSGNVPYGAFDASGELVGYVLGWLGMDPEDGLHVHSHMLAVLPGRRHGGIGRALKLAQRAQALDAGVKVVRWTFDPLVARNAYFNLVKLGATADRFHRHYYGDMEDEINRGERSDRLEARWDLRGPWPPVGPTVYGPTELVLGDDGPEDEPVPGAFERPTGTAIALVAVPSDYGSLRERDPGLASKWREAVADAIEASLAAGLTAQSFQREGTYVFLPRDRPKGLPRDRR